MLTELPNSIAFLTVSQPPYSLYLSLKSLSLLTISYRLNSSNSLSVLLAILPNPKKNFVLSIIKSLSFSLKSIYKDKSFNNVPTTNVSIFPLSLVMISYCLLNII